MPLTPDFSPNLRLADVNAEEAIPGEDVMVEVGGHEPDLADINERGDILSIRHGDGSVTVSVDGSPVERAQRENREGWFANLAEEVDHVELERISDELLRYIQDDIDSRRDWIEERSTGLKLLGLKIEVPSLQGAADSAPVEGMSRVRHPLLLEAVLRGQANARAELLPTDGPIKIRNDSSADSAQLDQLANALEKDLNHYLTVTASEYYPDTDRMLLMLFFGGTAFKKVYYCPLRMRPVSESVDADDLIINNSATDLRNARRVTHRTLLRPSVVKRLQILGVYRDLPLTDPVSPTLDSYQREEKAQQGVQPESMKPEDRDREIYECYCELNLAGFEHVHEGKPSGLELPYVVTIDVSSKEVLSLVRNYDEADKALPEPRPRFVKYTFVPGLGFYDIGLLHILGNATNALTAAWRELLDNGMFANFPGFLYSKTGSRQETTIFRVPPGGGAQIDTGGAPIGQAVMALPYNTTSMQPLMNLVTDIANNGQRIGGVSEQQVGEGRPDAPVGTTLAMIEQAAKIMNSVHKRLHAAQTEEFRLLIDCFREHPESITERKCKSGTQWDEATFLSTLNNCDLTPQADPNTASHSQRVMKIVALKQLQQASPALYDPIAVDKVAVEAIGFANPEQFFAPPSAQAQPPPELEEMKARSQAQLAEASAKTKIADAKVEELKAKIAQGHFMPKGLGGAQQPEGPDPAALMGAKARLIDAETNRQEAHIKAGDIAIEDQNRDLDRASRERLHVLGLARDILIHGAQQSQAAVGEAQKADEALKRGSDQS